MWGECRGLCTYSVICTDKLILRWPLTVSMHFEWTPLGWDLGVSGCGSFIGHCNMHFCDVCAHVREVRFLTRAARWQPLNMSEYSSVFVGLVLHLFYMCWDLHVCEWLVRESACRHHLYVSGPLDFCLVIQVLFGPCMILNACARRPDLSLTSHLKDVALPQG